MCFSVCLAQIDSRIARVAMGEQLMEAVYCIRGRLGQAKHGIHLRSKEALN